MPTYVYKVGGSLLDLPDLSSRICRVLAQSPGVQPLLVVGGAAAADLVRDWDRRHHLGEEESHWLALRAMMLNEALLAELKPECRIVRTRAEAELAWRAAHVPILCAHDFLRSEEAAALREPGVCSDGLLPHTWQTTSDSIAAWIAARWPADGLVLLKSCPPPTELPTTDQPDAPCDPLLHQLAARLARCGWIDLRHADPPRIDWTALHLLHGVAGCSGGEHNDHGSMSCSPPSEGGAGGVGSDQRLTFPERRNTASSSLDR